MSPLPKPVDIYTAIAAVSQEGFHVESTTTNQIPFSDLEQSAKFGDAAPRSVQEFAGEGVEDEVHTAASRFTHHTIHE